MYIYRCTSVSACVSLSAPTYWGQAEGFARLAFLLDTGFGSTRVLSDKGFCVQAWLGLSRPNLAWFLAFSAFNRSEIWLGGSAHTYIGIHTCGTKTRRGREGIIALETYVDMHIHASMHARMHACWIIHTCMLTYMHMSVYVCIHTQMYVYTYTNMQNDVYYVSIC